MYIVLDHDNMTGENDLIVYNTTDPQKALDNAIELVATYAWDVIGYELSEDGYDSEDYKGIYIAIDGSNKYTDLIFEGQDLARPTDEDGNELDINYPIVSYTIGESEENTHTIEVFNIVTVLDYL